jgi:phosphatidylglycerol lysyltransferase
MRKKPSKISFVLDIVSILVLIVGLIDIWSAIKPGMPQRLAILRPIFPYVIRSVVRLGTLLAGLFLIYLSSGLRKGKQIAWIISMVILISSLAFHLIKGLDVEEFAITLSLILLLIFERKSFVAHLDIPSVFQGIKFLFYSLFFTSVYGVLGMYVLERRHQSFDLFRAANEVVRMFFLVRTPEGINPALIPIFAGSIYLVGFSSLLLSVYMLFRPVIFRSRASYADLERAREILSKYSKFSLQNNLLLFDKHYFFGSAKEAFIAYKDSGSYSLVLGFPVGKEPEIDLIIGEFTDFCARQGRKPVFCNIETENLVHFEKFGFKRIEIGSEAFINPQTFSVEGGKSKHLRQALKKMDSMGYSAQVYSGGEISQILWRLRNISNEWLQIMHGSEKKFTVGRFSEKYLQLSKVIVVSDKKGHISAFVNFNEYSGNSLIVDLMRHGKNALPETMIYLFLKLIYWAKDNGYKNISLGDASLYGVGGQGRPLAEKTLKFIFDRVNGFYNFKGLYIFKNKFDPDWEPRYLVYPSQTDLGPSLVALLAADSSAGLGRDFLKEARKIFARK